jgi:hypothetical protein
MEAASQRFMIAGRYGPWQGGTALGRAVGWGHDLAAGSERAAGMGADFVVAAQAGLGGCVEGDA